jgi:NADH dehydrogenase
MGNRYSNAVVFGGSGFIGRYIVRRLAKTGARVVVPSRHPGQATYLRSAGNVGQVVPIAIDIHDDQSVATAVAGADLVVNLIGILAPGGRNSFDAVQHQAAARIARAAKAAGAKRFVQVSALGANAASNSSYATSKAAGEQAVLAAFPEATILRPSVVFGPDDQFFNRFAAMASTLPCLPLIGGGRTLMQPVYVGDVADAVLAVVEGEGAQGRTYELTGPRRYSFKELMQFTVNQIGRPGKCMVSLGFGLSGLLGSFLQLLPGKPLTADQVELLKVDNVASGKLPGLSDLGIEAQSIEVIVPTYLDKFRIGGRFTQPGGTVA